MKLDKSEKTWSMERISSAISGGLEDSFYRLGIFISKRPAKVILASVSIVIFCSLGLFNFYEEKNMVKLWIPESTDFAHNYKWLMENYPPLIRFNSLIFESDDNILTPRNLEQMLRIHRKVEKIRTVSGISLQGVCMKLPILSVDIDGAVQRSKRNADSGDQDRPNTDEWGDFIGSFDDLTIDNDESELDAIANEETFRKISKGSSHISMNQFDPSVVFYPDQYCPVVTGMRTACFENSILEIFVNEGYYDEKTEKLIKQLTQEQIINAINTVTESGVFKMKQNFEHFLGGIERNSTGHIISARSTIMKWVLKANVSTEKLGASQYGLDDQIDSGTMDFEEKLVEVLSETDDYPQGLRSYPNVQRSFGDLSQKAIWDDVKFLIVGYLLVYGYVQIMLGKFNRVEHRMTLGFMALLNVALGILTSFGICSVLGLSYGPMHSLIPCLLVGLGVDNTFVLVQALDNVNLAEKRKGSKLRDLPERFGEALKHAGVGVTITSTTDIIVFLVGGTTVLPSLRSYSIYTGIGIAATYFLQITFFTSCLYLDQKRIEANRDGVFWCFVVKPNHQEHQKPRLDRLATCFKQLGELLQNIVAKAIVIFLTIGLLGIGIYGTLQLRVQFDYVEFLPQDSGLYKWFQTKAKYFPNSGEAGIVVLADFEMKSEIPKIKRLTEEFQSQNIFISHFESWYPEFEGYVNENFLPDNYKLPGAAKNISQQFFNEKITQYLFSPRGAKFKSDFVFDNATTLKCGDPAPKIQMSIMKFSHPSFDHPGQQIEAMNWVKGTLKHANIPGRAFAMAETYSRWEIDEVIANELYRNLLLAIVCVSITTLLLLADIKAAVFVILCVLVTLIDVGGFMFFWGLTIDIVAATNIIISVGLCVDFAAHLTHTFMKQGGPLNDRLTSTMVTIGPAIFHGGISTLLAVVMLADSISHVFQSYFKIFFLMIVLGLFHGLVFLPVLLSLLGPKPYSTVSLTDIDDTPTKTTKHEANGVEGPETII